MARQLFAHPLWLIPATLIALTAIATFWRWVLRQSTPPVETPPMGFSPIEASVLVDGRFDAEDVVAGVVQLAVRGIVGLQRLANGDVLMAVKRDWQNETGLLTADLSILARIYAHGDAVRPLSEFRGTRQDFEDISDTLAETMAEQGLLAASPSALRRIGRWTTIVVTGGWLQFAWNASAPAAVYAAGIVTGLVLWGLANRIPKRFLSSAGRRTRLQLFGFRAFLRRATHARLDRMPPDTMHRFLPWAITLGVTDAWLGRFVGRKVAPNHWYSAPTPLSLVQLGAEIKKLRALLRPRRR